MVETWLHPHYPRSRWSFWRYSFYSEKLSQDCLYRMSTKAKSRFYAGILVYCWDQQLFGLQRHFLYWFSSDQCSFLFVDNQIHGMNKGGTCKLNDDISVTAVHAVWFLFFFFFNIQDHSSSFDDSPMSGGEAMGYIIRTSEGIQPAFVWWCRYFYLSYWWYSYLWRHVLDLCHLQALCLPHVHRRQLHNGYNWGCLCFEPCISSSVALMWLVAAFCETCYSYALQDLWIADWHSRSRRAALGKGWCEDCSHRAWKCVWSSLSVWI